MIVFTINSDLVIYTSFNATLLADLITLLLKLTYISNDPFINSLATKHLSNGVNSLIINSYDEFAGIVSYSDKSILLFPS